MFPEPSGPWEVAVEAGPDVGAFLSVWGSGPDDAWAVGGQVATIGGDGAGAIFHRDVSGWTPVGVPEDTPLLNWVHGAGDEIWAVGNAGMALRYDGSAWRSMDTGAGVPLWGVFVFGADDVWAVGGDAFDRDTPGIVIHYDGNAWQPSQLPTIDREFSAIFKIFGLAPDDVHAVGAAGVILRFDGSEWTQMGSGTGNDMISLWGAEPDDLVAVGGRGNSTISRYDGSAWTTEEGTLAGLNGVWVDPEGRASIVGNMGVAAVLREGFMPESEDAMAGTFNVLHAVYGFEDGTRVAVGGSLGSSPPYTGLIVENTP